MPKMVKIQYFQLFLILYLHKIKTFGAKIQIIQVKLACKTFQKNIFFLFQKFNFAMFDFSEY